MDAEGGLEFLLSREDIDRRRIIVYGRSLGWSLKFPTNFIQISHIKKKLYKWTAFYVLCFFYVSYIFLQFL